MLARRHRPAATDARRAGMLGHDAESKATWSRVWPARRSSSRCRCGPISSSAAAGATPSTPGRSCTTRRRPRSRPIRSYSKRCRSTAAAESGRAHICVHCRLDPPDGSEVLSAYNDEWLHARCQDAFIRARMAEESIAWEAPQLAAAPRFPRHCLGTYPTSTTTAREATRKANQTARPMDQRQRERSRLSVRGERDRPQGGGIHLPRSQRRTVSQGGQIQDEGREESPSRNITGRTGAGKAASPKGRQFRIASPNCWRPSRAQTYGSAKARKMPTRSLRSD